MDDKTIDVLAMLDTGSAKSWINPDHVAKGKYSPMTVEAISTKGFSGKPVETNQAVSVKWNDLTNYKSRTSTFYIAPQGCPFGVAFGREFIDAENLYIRNPNANIFSVGGIVKRRLWNPFRRRSQNGSEHSPPPSDIEIGTGPLEDQEEATV